LTASAISSPTLANSFAISSSSSCIAHIPGGGAGAEALTRALGDTEPVDGFSAAKLRHYFLSNPLESGDRYFKLLLSQTDDALLKAIIKNSELPKEPSLRVTQNFALFSHLLAEQKGEKRLVLSV
jgi:hypothetical protein